jgi:uncharacterized membrane protein
MAVLLSLLLGTAAARIAGWLGVDYVDGWPQAIAVGLALMFTMTGVAHFAPGMRRDMIAIVPPALRSRAAGDIGPRSRAAGDIGPRSRAAGDIGPMPGVLVTVTGVLELVGAAGLLFPPTRAAAAACLFVLMLAMFPANVYASRMPNPPKSMTSRLSVRSGQEMVYLAAAVVVAVCGG